MLIIKKHKERFKKESTNRNGHLGMKYSNSWKLNDSISVKKYFRKKRKQDLKKYSRLIKLLEKDEIFNGLMLSDGCIANRPQRTFNSRFSLLQKDENEDFVLKIQKHFQDLGIDSSIKKYFKEDKRKEWKDGWVINFYTSHNIIFTELRKKWYKDNKKIIPKNLKLTQKTLAYLFMGDGFSSWKNGKWKTVTATICSESFSLYYLKLLKSKLEKLGLTNISLEQRKKNQYRICISKNSETTKFMELIEPYIIPCFKYKIKYPKMEALVN